MSEVQKQTSGAEKQAAASRREMEEMAERIKEMMAARRTARSETQV